MSTTETPLDRFRQNLIRTVSQQRFTLLLAGLGISLIGLVAILAPLALAESFLRVIGFLFLISAVIKAGQWLIGRFRGGHQVHGLFAVACHVFLDLLVGCFLISNTRISVPLLTVVIGITLFSDGVVQLLVGWRMHDWRHRLVLFVSGGLTCLIAILAAIFYNDPAMTDWLAYLIGAKLLLFGGTLIYMALTARENHVAQVYGATATHEVPKIPGEAYAVFIGNSFHLGVYVGDDHVVDFRDTNMVYEVTWDQFLLGREPQHWEYPDLAETSPEEICRFALSQVGKSLPYNFFTFNCEHFAIWCKSLGQLKASKFAQVNAAYENVANRPLLGMMVELYSRLMEWLAFKLGGAFGKKASLWLRGNSALLSRWILTARLEKQEPSQKD